MGGWCLRRNRLKKVYLEVDDDDYDDDFDDFFISIIQIGAKLGLSP
jgi:hypothetical protein